MRIDYVSFLWTALRDAIFGSVLTAGGSSRIHRTIRTWESMECFRRENSFSVRFLPRKSFVLFIAALHSETSNENYFVR